LPDPAIPTTIIIVGRFDIVSLIVVAEGGGVAVVDGPTEAMSASVTVKADIGGGIGDLERNKWTNGGRTRFTRTRKKRKSVNLRSIDEQKQGVGYVSPLRKRITMKRIVERKFHFIIP